MSKKNSGVKLIAQNKKAFHEYFVEETFQAGIVLVGTEVKSLRSGKCNLKDSYIKIEKGEAFLYNAHISPYEQGNIFNRDPLRKRKLLLHKKQIVQLEKSAMIDGYTIVPLKIYISQNLIKVDIGIAKGKKLHDKRQTIAKRDAQREMDRVSKSQYTRGK